VFPARCPNSCGDIYEFRGDTILNEDTDWKLVERHDRL
jgi:hypothetical protein